MKRNKRVVYSALEVNDSVVALLCDEVLRHSAWELVETVSNNSSIDWAICENVQNKMMIALKKILLKYVYPSDLQIKATKTVIKQAKLLANEINDPKVYKLNKEPDFLVAAEP